MSDPIYLEYRVRPVTRYIVTRFAKHDDTRQEVGTQGEYLNEHTAHEVAYALCQAEGQRLGWGPGDERIQFPVRGEFATTLVNPDEEG